MTTRVTRGAVSPAGVARVQSALRCSRTHSRSTLRARRSQTGIEAGTGFAIEMIERRVHRQRWVGALHAKVPLRVINGADDPVSGAHMIRRLREELPEADVVMLPGIGHYPQIEDPESVMRAYLEFRAGLDNAAGAGA